jgi:hypothetical protein
VGFIRIILPLVQGEPMAEVLGVVILAEMLEMEVGLDIKIILQLLLVQATQWWSALVVQLAVVEAE